MAQQQFPTIHTPTGLVRVGQDQPAANLHLHAGWWQASCPTCGYVMVEGRHQARVERKAARASCPVCVEVA
jgi:hypothetical protein